ncbi:thiamine pyrophosphate-dependent dehydrogenase E1 component subunit alpha [Bordetella hinzii]|uniref:thiamine pyrophosphate-dependent dehydrogenase E1 component subunit alpha n=1 Tax=Bordetella hinzii TaxID=103855 RepID=UPI000459D5EE|nr:thiamine pyrophosphate-dependent dehydrogenase E1 component subunit alpha [Bordetella hinzii]KCB46610.1 putative TPP-dependent acetoin dehydrogenase complex, E1 component, alpha subunit [Bordetella hinzii 4161]KXA71420.1 ABC transporter substrate-binding protein [Bordetella hinzii LMG 13501]QDJ37658.1 ABC transporter substrate-binding protein [Bordetella hinzii]QDJ46747.1 ABC transporter substrate-binding protein [Bordetella hinzii]VEH25398.1 pyruvate dehydrogenase E1 component subunit alph
MASKPDTGPLLALFRTMKTIRAVESSLVRLFADGEVPGFIHLSLGQEGVAAGVCSVLGADDTLATTHRGHGHVLARGLSLPAFFKEVMGREGGICRGRGGSMHVADMDLGILGANGIVGAGIPIAMGSAVAHQVRGNGAIAVAFFGDGAMAEGVLHETLNMARLWRLPLLLVCENNGWSEFSPSSRQLAFALRDLAGAFGIDYQAVDGNDAAAVAASAARAAERLRRGEGPAVLECATRRIRGHYEGDPQKYRAGEDLALEGEDDPLARTRAALRKAGVKEEVLAAQESEVDARVAQAIEAARADALPAYEAARLDVYTVPA